MPVLVGQCTQCAEPPSTEMLVCNRCHRPTHFSCTRLPPYILTQIVRKEEKLRKQRKGKEGTFRCESCTGDVPDIIAWHSTDRGGGSGGGGDVNLEEVD